MKPFEIKKHPLPTPEQSYARLVGSSKDNQIVELSIDLIDEIDNQPHKIHEEQIENIANSISHAGQIEPVIVVQNPERKGRYTLLSGRHRVRACELLNQDTVKAVIISETDPDKQRLILLSSNNDRNSNYLPSELAYAYLEQKQLFEKLGTRKTTAKVAETIGSNRKSVHKFIQLTNLTKPLLYRVDKGELTVGAGYELSFLDTKYQESVNVYLINNPGTHLIKETARLIRDNPKDVDEIIKAANAPVTLSDNTSPALSAKTPKQTQKQSKTSEESFTESEKSAISHNIYCWLDADINKLIISSFASTDDVVAFFHKLCLTYRSWRCDVTFGKYKEEWIDVSFSKNKCTVTFCQKQYAFTLKEVDALVRDYIKRYLTTDKIIEILKDK